MRRSDADRGSDFLLTSALLGFLIGVGMWVVLRVVTLVVEGPHPYYGGVVDFIITAIIFGVVWAIICLISFPLMWRAWKPGVPMWPASGRVALAAFLVQIAVIFAFDLLITRFDLRPRIDANISDGLWTAAVIAVGIIPALLTAFIEMRRLGSAPLTKAVQKVGRPR
jgi:hypothetical protein